MDLGRETLDPAQVSVNGDHEALVHDRHSEILHTPRRKIVRSRATPPLLGATYGISVTLQHAFFVCQKRKRDRWNQERERNGNRGRGGEGWRGVG